MYKYVIQIDAHYEQVMSKSHVVPANRAACTIGGPQGMLKKQIDSIVSWLQGMHNKQKSWKACMMIKACKIGQLVLMRFCLSVHSIWFALQMVDDCVEVHWHIRTGFVAIPFAGFLIVTAWLFWAQRREAHTPKLTVKHCHIATIWLQNAALGLQSMMWMYACICNATLAPSRIQNFSKYRVRV